MMKKRWRQLLAQALALTLILCELVSAKAELPSSVTVGEKTLAGLSWKTVAMSGLTVPQLSGSEQWQEEGPFSLNPGEYAETALYGDSSGLLADSGAAWISSAYYVCLLKETGEPLQVLTERVSQTEDSFSERNFDQIGRIYLNGYPVVYGIREETHPDGWRNRMIELCGQVRNYQLDLSYGVNGDGDSILPILDTSFLAEVTGRITLDGQPVAVLDHESVPTLTQENGITEVSAGSSIQFSAGDPDPVFGGIVWEITGEDGEATKAATISKNGLVRAGNVREAAQVIVKARYEACSESAEAELTVYPAVQKISISSEDTFMYAGSGKALLLTASCTPETAKLIGLKWSVSKSETAEIKDNGDGTATLTPLTPGTATVTATDSAGKKGTARFTVTDRPVTAVEIIVKGTPAPGRTVSLSATLTPAQAARKDVLWSIDADESVAAVNARGQLKIMKDVPAGTVITVTCTALGAPEPVKAELTLTVEE